MFRKTIYPLILAFLCQFCVLLGAQDKTAPKTPRERLAAAHAQYYTPTASGLQSFHCDAQINWKDMLSRMNGSDIAADNPALVYLHSVRLTVTDDLKGAGSLQWTATRETPPAMEASVKQMQEGLQAMMGGFFQSWNAYMNGSMVPLPDASVTVTASGDGLHLSTGVSGMSVDEDFDKNMLLVQTIVAGPELKVVAKPTYVYTPDGLIVSEVSSLVNQPPSAPDTQAIFHIDYAKVDSYQIPSRVVIDIKNIGVFDVAFSSCKVTTAPWAQKPLP